MITTLQMVIDNHAWNTFALDDEELRTINIMLLPRLSMMMRGQGWTFTDASIPGRLWTLDKYSLWDPRNADIPAALLFNTQIQTAIQNKYNQFGIVERLSVESWMPCKVIIGVKLQSVHFRWKDASIVEYRMDKSLSHVCLSKNEQK